MVHIDAYNHQVFLCVRCVHECASACVCKRWKVHVYTCVQCHVLSDEQANEDAESVNCMYMQDSFAGGGGTFLGEYKQMSAKQTACKTLPCRGLGGMFPQKKIAPH